jgi:glycosyltransferase involved in cell wall biosynthesis
MRKNSVAIASVLKPVKDPRAYFRFGFSLRETNKYEINIIGFSSKSEPPEGDIHFQTLFSKQRTHPKRLLVSWAFLVKIWKIRPEILIVTTYELLPVSVLAKWILKYKLVYDVQENYILNISQNRTVGGFARWIATAIVGIFESCSRPFVDHFFLAERCYLEELPKFRPATLLENRFFKPVVSIQSYQLSTERPLRFLISGTITEVYGTLTGIQWFKEFKKRRPNSELHVIGHCPKQSFQEKLEEEMPFVGLTLEISSSPIPYERILNAYHQADIVLLPYWQIESIREKVPSKLYESLALGKICLFSPNPKWDEIVKSFGGGFAVDFRDFSGIPNVVLELDNRSFFTKNPDVSLTWKSQETEFLDTIASFVK